MLRYAGKLVTITIGILSAQICIRYFKDVPQSRCGRSEEHTSELQSHSDLVCRLLLEKKKIKKKKTKTQKQLRWLR